MRLIDADKLINELHKTVSSEDGYWKTVDVIKQQPTVEENKWISVDDELPSERDAYLISTKGRVMLAYWSEIFEGWRSLVSDNSINNVIAWQPLPKPYELKGSE